MELSVPGPGAVHTDAEAYSVRARALSLGVKRLEHEADQSSQCSVEVMDLQEVGGSCGDWRELAQDRVRWRALVATVRNLRVPKMRGIS